jgi:hypothetical protein
MICLPRWTPRPEAMIVAGGRRTTPGRTRIRHMRSVRRVRQQGCRQFLGTALLSSSATSCC